MYNRLETWGFHWPILVGIKLQELRLGILELEDMYSDPPTIRTPGLAGTIDVIGMTRSVRFVWFVVEPRMIDRMLCVRDVLELSRQEFDDALRSAGR